MPGDHGKVAPAAFATSCCIGVRVPARRGREWPCGPQGQNRIVPAARKARTVARASAARSVEVCLRAAGTKRFGPCGAQGQNHRTLGMPGAWVPAADPPAYLRRQRRDPRSQFAYWAGVKACAYADIWGSVRCELTGPLSAPGRFTRLRFWPAGSRLGISRCFVPFLTLMCPDVPWL